MAKPRALALMGNVLKPGFFDTNAHSWASFGMVRGIHRSPHYADKRGVKTSIMVNGVLAERDPKTVKLLAAHAGPRNRQPLLGHGCDSGLTS
jgi:hypothetical protein